MSKNYNKINETILTEQAKFNTPMQASHSLGSVLKKKTGKKQSPTVSVVDYSTKIQELLT